MFRGDIKLITIRGIEIRLDYSWFIIFTLVTWSLASQYFPQKHPDWPVSLFWVLGLVTSLLFFVSVLLHELSHSFVAQARGIHVPRITLFIFGGAAQIAEEPKSAGDEFMMAAAGPAMSVLLSMLAAGVWFMFHRLGYEAPASLFGWLALINLMLAIFNMIPGFPLDGGRVLRAIIWGSTSDMGKATRIAAAVGKGVAYLFILLGVIQVFSGMVFNGIWMAFIGWFLLQAATSSSRQEVLKRLLAGHTAAEAMITDCPVIESNTLVADLVNRYILGAGRRCFPVVEDGRVTGIVTLHNVKTLPPEEWPYKDVRSIMLPAQSLKAVAPETPLAKAMEMMMADGVNQAPVVKDGRFVGMVTRETIMQFLGVRSELGLR